MKKMVFKLDLPDTKAKQKAMIAVIAFPGIVSVAIEMKSKTLTVIGDADPLKVVTKLRKSWPTDIISVGPAKAPEKNKEEPEKKEPKKEESKQKEPKKEEIKKEEPKQKEPKKEEIKKEEPKQKEPKKEEIKKEEPKQKEPKKEEPKQRRPKEKEPMKEEPQQRRPEEKEPNPSQYEQIYDVVKAYKEYNPQMTYYYAQSIEEKSDACIIC